jgi:hypothetical protein
MIIAADFYAIKYFPCTDPLPPHSLDTAALQDLSVAGAPPVQVVSGSIIIGSQM